MPDVNRHSSTARRALTLSTIVLPVLLGGAVRAGEVDFVREVAPIFEKHCLLCHKSGKAEGELDLTTAAGLRESGFVEANNPGESHLLDVVTAGKNERPRMPKSGPPLSKDQVEILERWIREGARWPKGIRLPILWSLKPVTSLTSNDQSIDRFIRTRLSERGLDPAPTASRRVLIRRLKFDLVGLPPTPEEIAAFVNDKHPDAWERLIERFLKSPHYGERWAQHWLDVVRFSESNGFEEDSMRLHAWPYRDYVIRSLNADKPYDQFVREQLAGDVLKPLTKDGMIATTMLVNGPYDHAAVVSQSVVERTRAREVMLEEMLTTVCQSILGLTVNCARCHDHKFDPIPQLDYYRIKAVFDGVQQNIGRLYEPRRILLPVEEAAWKREEAALREMERQLATLRERKSNFTDTKNLQPLNRATALWQFDGSASATKDSDRKGGQSAIDAKGTARFGISAGERIPAANSDQKILDAGSSTIVRNQADGAGYAILPNIDGSELVPRGEAMSIFARVRFTGHFNGIDDVFRIGDRGKPTRDTCGFEFVQSDSDGNHARARFAVTGQGSEKEVGVTLPVDLNLDTWYDLVGVFDPKEGDRGVITLTVSRPGESGPLAKPVSADVDFGKLSTAASQNLLFFVAPSFLNGPQPGAQLDVAAVWHEALAEQEIRWLSVGDTKEIPMPSADENAGQKLDMEIADRDAEVKAARAKSDAVAKAMIGYRMQPEPTVLFERGDVRSPGPTVVPAGLSSVTALSSDFKLAADSDEAERRRRFAAWVTDARNPLTARVIVNRVWHHHFGAGIVDTPSDFGVNGGRPSHPALLDWLTALFIKDGWSLKKLHRRILMSETWQQSSRSNAAATQSDSGNRFLWRFTPRRLDAESVRDAMLFISGELNSTAGGPSFQPFTTTRFNTTFYHLFDKGEPEFNRRTIYRMHINTGRDPLLDTLDCPAPSVLTPVRRETVTPLQALGLMNNSFVLRQSEKLAERILASRSDLERQITEAWQKTHGREPRPEEIRSARNVIRESDLKTLCWVLFNSSEFLQIR